MQIHHPPGLLHKDPDLDVQGQQLSILDDDLSIDNAEVYPAKGRPAQYQTRNRIFPSASKAWTMTSLRTSRTPFVGDAAKQKALFMIAARIVFLKTVPTTPYTDRRWQLIL